MIATRAQRTVLEARLERDKLQLRNALHSLADAARAKVDVRSRILERPILWLAGALALGLGLGARR